ncbi:hypothetical protein D3C78_361310 [compost metagenome]
MAMSTQQRSAKTAAKRQRLGEEELRHRVRKGTKDQVSDLMSWAEFEEMAELMQTMIRNTHALGREGARRFLALQRHEYEIPQNVARKLKAEGQREAERLDRSEQ